MYPLSGRVKRLYGETLEKRQYMPYIEADWLVYTALGMASCIGREVSGTELFSEALAGLIDGFNPFIVPDERITGFNYRCETEVYMPYAAMRDTDRLVTDTPEGRQWLADRRIPPEDIERFFAVREGLKDLYRYMPHEPYTEDEKDTDADWSAKALGVVANHSVIGYEKVVRGGFESVLREIAECEAENGPSPLYPAARRVCESAMHIGEKYAAEAQRLLGSGDARYAEADLRRIIEVCTQVPRRGARTFEEAVQAVWFAHLINTWEDGVNANSLGHLDLILWPYYEHDIKAGTLTRGEAFEILCCLWLKLYRDYDVQQSCLGGTAPDGSTLVNELSYMMLDVTEALGFVRCLSVHFGKSTPRDFLSRALEVVGRVQKGIPFFFNDDVMVPALESKGISHEDACNYAQIGCVETVIPGKSNPHAVTGEVNVLKALEYVMNDGVSMTDPGVAAGLKTGPLSQYETFGSFCDAVKRQAAHLTGLTCSKLKKLHACSGVNDPKVYKSMLTEGCLESGRDWNGFGAKYDYYQVLIGGVPNLADSLAVIRKFVYEEKLLTLEELKDALERDFPDEPLRRMFVNKAPKYGNGDPEADAVAADIIGFECDVLERESAEKGMSFHAQPFTYLWMIDMGRHTAATPDGRHKGEILAYSMSPMQGRDFSGLTALMSSLTSLPTKRTPGTASAIVEIDPSLFNERNIGLLTDVLQVAGEKGLSNVQFNTVDAATLIDAQKHPEKHRNLAVRVSGFSQKFNLLSRELQDHIICRTKHAAL